MGPTPASNVAAANGYSKCNKMQLLGRLCPRGNEFINNAFVRGDEFISSEVIYLREKTIFFLTDLFNNMMLIFFFSSGRYFD